MVKLFSCLGKKVNIYQNIYRMIDILLFMITVCSLSLTLQTSYILMMSSKRLQRSLRNVTTSIAELTEHMEVKPTMSEKKMVTKSQLCGSTDFPDISCSAIYLKSLQKKQQHKIRLTEYSNTKLYSSFFNKYLGNMLARSLSARVFSTVS